MPSWTAIKSLVKYLPYALVGLVVAGVYILIGQRDRARNKVKDAKASLKASEDAREQEHEIDEKQAETKTQRFEERKRQDQYKQSGDRPESFGDDRLK